MSFDIFTFHFRDGEKCATDPLPVFELLARYGAEDIGQEDCRIIFSDGVDLWFPSGRLRSADGFYEMPFFLHGLPDTLLTFIYDLAVAADFVIFNAQGNDAGSSPMTILVSEAQRVHLPEGVTDNPTIARSAQHFCALVLGDFERWENYRDQVCGLRQEEAGPE